MVLQEGSLGLSVAYAGVGLLDGVSEAFVCVGPVAGPEFL